MECSGLWHLQLRRKTVNSHSGRRGEHPRASRQGRREQGIGDSGTQRSSSGAPSYRLKELVGSAGVLLPQLCSQARQSIFSCDGGA